MVNEIGNIAAATAGDSVQSQDPNNLRSNGTRSNSKHYQRTLPPPIISILAVAGAMMGVCAVFSQVNKLKGKLPQ